MTGREPAPACDTGGDGVPSCAERFESPCVVEPAPTCYELAVFGGPDPARAEPFVVETGEHLHVWYYRAPWDGPVEATRLEAQLDAAQVIREAALYSTPSAGVAGGFHEVSIGIPIEAFEDTVLLASLAGDARTFHLPADTALWLPPAGTLLAVQWHYLNDTAARVPDRSALQVCTQPAGTRARSAALTLLGTEDLGGTTGLRPGRSRVRSRCTNDSGETVQVLAVSPRMQQTGIHTTLQLRRAAGGDPEPLFDQPFDSRCPRYHELYARLEPGDAIETTCDYDNAGPNVIGFGNSHFQETCYALALTAPPHALASGDLSLAGVNNTCLGPAF